MKKVFLISLIFLFFLPAFQASAFLRSRVSLWYSFLPTAAIDVPLQAKVNEWVGANVSGSYDFLGISKVSFFYDNILNGSNEGSWLSGSYEWNTSAGDWDSVNKTMKLKFTSAGDYEVWVRVINIFGRSSLAFDTITIASPPTVSTAGETWVHCSIEEKSAPILNWDYFDGTQAAYWIQIDNTSADFPSPEVGAGDGEILSPSSSYAPTYAFNWDTKYWWRVKVKNQQDIWSGWSNVGNFQMPKHAYPWTDFNWSPAEPVKGETVEFDSSSAKAFGGAAISSYLWTIIQGTGVFVDGTTDISANPHIQFSITSNKVKLQVTDSDNYSCGAGAGEGEKSITVQLPLPEYKEIPPIIWFRKLLAGFLAFK